MRTRFHQCVAAAALAISVAAGRLAEAAPAAVSPPAEPMSLWSDKPGNIFTKSYPIGNGRLGGSILGGIEQDRIALNESSLWSGGRYDGNNYDGYNCLPEVRRLMLAGNVAEADPLLWKSFGYAQGVSGWNDPNQFGCSQTLGDLNISFVFPAKTGAIITYSPKRFGENLETIEMSVDGQRRADGTLEAGESWSYNCQKKPVTWQAELAKPERAASYTLIGANPKEIAGLVLEASNDGTAWTVLDRKAGQPVFEKENQTRTFPIAQPGEYRFYRFTFTPRSEYFTMREISLDGIVLRAKKPADYRRDLNVMTGTAHTEFTRDSVSYTRDYVASKPDEVIAVRLTASKPGALSFTASLARHQRAKMLADGKFHRLEGQMAFNKPGVKGDSGEGMRFVALLGATAKGGTTEATDNGITIKNADEATLLVSAGTSWATNDFEPLVRNRLAAALAKPGKAIQAEAEAHHRSFMDRCSLSLPKGDFANLPTLDRMEKSKWASKDPDLFALNFQMVRHLIVAGSQPDSQLPTHLQGIWAEEYSTPWRGDFHSNINIQENYWAAEVANLSDCHLPLMRFIKNVAKEGEKTAKAYYNAPGWMANHTQNPWYDTSPSCLPACSGPVSGFWLVQHIWEHYNYTLDRKFLAEYYPIMRGACELAQAVLIEDPKTRQLINIPSNSPENNYRYVGKDRKKRDAWLCIASTYDMTLFRNLFKTTAQAARVLGMDKDFAKSIEATGARLAPTRVNKEGRIMEWQEDFEEAEIGHRHTSHLWGLHPGTEISSKTPELLKAVRRSLERRGQPANGWSHTWRTFMWARMHDNVRADGQLSTMVEGGHCGNFLNLWPFQIDATYASGGAIAELLIQSHEEQDDGSFLIDLLPALPESWKKSGAYDGLRARGGFDVAVTWKNGVVDAAKITSRCGSPCALVNPCPGERVVLYRNGKKAETLSGKQFAFKTKAGESILIVPEGSDVAEAFLPASAPVKALINQVTVESPCRLPLNVSTAATLQAGPQAKVFYTLDGSRPTRQSTAYTAPLSLNKPGVLRAMAVEPGRSPNLIQYVFRSAESGAQLSNTFDSEADLDRVKITGTRAFYEPRWIKQAGPEAMRNPLPGKQGILGVRPAWPHLPAEIERMVQVPAADKHPRLHIVVSADPNDGGLTCLVQAGVCVDGKNVEWFKEELLSGKTDGWQTFDYDLSKYAGRCVAVKVRCGAGNRGSAWKDNNWGYFDEISVIADGQREQP
ncbi:MAG: glycoside hydrolase N-terminal domain-containing protein [Planctomycetota bacterium]|nr:glycoside hydrolase N-terminal domain-containing protein [Planctomycetota bacterium]